MRVFAFLCLLRSVFADLVVNTSTGPVQGVSSLAEDVEAFLGIPYAEPPVNELRFSKTVPKKQWVLIHNASNFPPPCPQNTIGPYYFWPDTTNMSEDCLYLNVWAPKPLSHTNPRPVIFYIHPGAFSSGSSNLKAHDGSHFASRGDVVVVTINYRLATLGYFLADTEEESGGNMGMYDQITAMKWVKENAKQFGGDPENIVLLGVSAGAISVTTHMASPLSKNLFRKAIIQSGSMINPLVEDNVKLYERSKAVASFLGCANDTMTLKDHPNSVIKCLKSEPLKNILEAEKLILLPKYEVFFPREKDEFLPKSVINSVREGNFRKDTDVLIGMNKEEGSLFLALVLHDYLGFYGENEFAFSKTRALSFIQAILSMMKVSNSTGIAQQYLSLVKNPTTIERTKMIANVIGDYMISCSTLFFADFLSLKGNSVYFFKFDFRSPSTPMAEWIGTTHLDEVQYVFGNPYHQNFTAEEIELSHLMIDRWSAFAKTGYVFPSYMCYLQSMKSGTL